MNKSDIEKILPVRDPYLIIDEVEIEVPEKKGVGKKHLTGKEYFFEGHFPGRPVMPGVLIVEAITQTAMVVLNRGDLKMKALNNVKFRQTIEPGDNLLIKIELNSMEDNQYKIKGEVLVNDSPAASGQVFLSVR